VIATAVVTGAEAASETYELDVRTVRGWLAESGKVPANGVSRDRWRELADLAITRAQSALLGGKVRPKDAAVIGAIATRYAAKPEPMAEPATPEDAWGDAADAALLKHHKGHAPIAMVAIIEWLAELDQDGPAPAVPQCLDHLEGLGDLQHWRARRDAERHAADFVTRERVRVAALWAAQGYPAAERWARAAEGPPDRDPETLGLVDEDDAIDAP
jgi:hypothetical protein